MMIQQDKDDAVVAKARAELKRIQQESITGHEYPDDVPASTIVVIRVLQAVFIVFCVYTLVSLFVG